jgi:hypothetical protein
VLVCFWLVGDVRFVTKFILTLLSFAIWALLLWTPAVVVVAQCVLIAVMGAATFGVDWLSRRIR